MSDIMTADQSLCKTFEEFWPYYLSQHSKRTTRVLHVVGSMGALTAVLAAACTRNPGWIVLAPVVGYGLAWLAHSQCEDNHPATFTYPAWSLRGDFRMVWLWSVGKLEAELVKFKIMT